LFVAEPDRRVVGFVSVSTRQHFTGALDAYIGRLVVDAHAERAGVGTALVEP
jgi:predicted N-acetyltransferase YhbS